MSGPPGPAPGRSVSRVPSSSYSIPLEPRHVDRLAVLRQPRIKQRAVGLGQIEEQPAGLAVAQRARPQRHLVARLQGIAAPALALEIVGAVQLDRPMAPALGIQLDEGV